MCFLFPFEVLFYLPLVPDHVSLMCLNGVSLSALHLIILTCVPFALVLHLSPLLFVGFFLLLIVILSKLLCLFSG